MRCCMTEKSSAAVGIGKPVGIPTISPHPRSQNRRTCVVSLNAYSIFFLLFIVYCIVQYCLMYQNCNFVRPIQMMVMMNYTNFN